MSKMEAAIAKDPQLRQAVDDFPIAQKIADSIIESEVRDVLREVSSSTNNTMTLHKAKPNYAPWMIAATFIAAMWVSYYQWNRYDHQQKIYASVMEKYQPLPTVGDRSTSLITQDKLSEAFRLYDLRKYDESLELFKEITPKTDTIHFYMSHLYLVQNKINLSKKHYNKIEDANLKNSIYQYLKAFE